MPIALETSGFYECYSPLNPAPSLGVDSTRLDEVIAYYHEKPFRGLFGHKSFGFDQSNLDFLARTSNATYLWLWDVTLDNIDGIYSLTQLAYTGIHPKRPGIDFSRLPALRTVVNHWIKADTGISSSAIVEYNLWHYKPRSKSFDGLEIPSGVGKLELNWVNPATLAGLPKLENLKRLEIHYCRNLCDLSTLPDIAPNLQSISVFSSKRVEPTAGLLDHPSLQSAYINGKVILDKSG
jgi:hypothetical protein